MSFIDNNLEMEEHQDPPDMDSRNFMAKFVCQAVDGGKNLVWQSSHGLMNPWQNPWLLHAGDIDQQSNTEKHLLSLTRIVADKRAYPITELFSSVVDSFTSGPLDLSVPSLDREVHLMSTAYRKLCQSNLSISAQGAVSHLTSLQQHLRPATWSREAVKNIRYSWKSMESIHHEIAGNDLLARYSRSQLMISHACVWVWLQTVCAQYSHPDVFQNINDTTMIASLARKLDRTSVTRTKNAPVLIPADFDSTLSRDPYVIPWNTLDSTFASGFVQQRWLFNKLLVVLADWLGFPDSPTTSAQAAFVFGLFQLFSSSVLLLDKTWAIYNNLGSILAFPHGNKVTMLDLLPFFLSVWSESQSFQSPNSRQAELLLEISKINNSFIQGEYNRKMPPSQDLAMVQIPRTEVLNPTDSGCEVCNSFCFSE